MNEQKQNETNEFLPSLGEINPEEQAKIDELIAHDPAEDVINLGDVDKLPEVVVDQELNPEELNKEEIKAPDELPNATVAKLQGLADNLNRLSREFSDLILSLGGAMPKIKIGQAVPAPAVVEEGQKIIEGLFDGEKMIGPDGQTYVVPANYASKSRLVDGDKLKLIITPAGFFIFKQIQPIERRRLVGLLEEGEDGEFYVLADDRRWRVLTASVSYYKGQAGDEVVILVPQEGWSKWGAVENIIKR